MFESIQLNGGFYWHPELEKVYAKEKEKKVIKTQEKTNFMKDPISHPLLEEKRKEKKDPYHITTRKPHNIHLWKKENKTRAMPHTVIKKED